MGSATCTIFGLSVLAVLLAGYLGQRYLPPPTPKIIGIDLGTTYSCVSVYHAVTGRVDVLRDAEGKKCIPSVVAFSDDKILVGYKAVAQSEKNPANTIYDAKRFIGKKFTQEELNKEASRYPFKMVLDSRNMVKFAITSGNNVTLVTPEYIGSQILTTLRDTAMANLSVSVGSAVMSVPAEFNEEQRNYTRRAAALAGMEVLRVINEPTAAALAYGLHKKKGVDYIMVVDLGGGTLDVSLLFVQGGMFLTQGMAGNNHLGGQDFNERLMSYLQKQVMKDFGQVVHNPEDLQTLRQAVEDTKLKLTSQTDVTVKITFNSIRTSKNQPAKFVHKVTRDIFSDLNADLFAKVLEPIDKILEVIEIPKDYIDEIVLVGGSTRIPKVRELIRDYFSKQPNTAIDPELAVASGVGIQAGILGGMWPLTVSSTEVPTTVRKIHLN